MIVEGAFNAIKDLFREFDSLFRGPKGFVYTDTGAIGARTHVFINIVFLDLLEFLDPILYLGGTNPRY